MTTTPTSTVDPDTSPDVTAEIEILSDPDTEKLPISARARLARARATLIVTLRGTEFLPWPRRWWIYTERPMSIRAAWRMSAHAYRDRVPHEIPWLLTLWRIDNRIGTRPLLFLLAMIAPHVLSGPILWCASRPARRLGLVIVSTALWLCHWLPAVL
jgi:hypothetical protein